jgi:hypothetical protein
MWLCSKVLNPKRSKTKHSETKWGFKMKRISDKINTTTLILAISCLILLIALIIAVAYWDSSNSAYINLQSQTSTYVNDHSHTNQEFESLKSQLLADENELNSQNSSSVAGKLLEVQNELSTLENFDNTTNLVSDATVNPSGSHYSFHLNFSGYITLTLSPTGSSITDWYAQITWTYYSTVHYNQTITFGENGYGFVAGFPVISSPNAPLITNIVIGNTALSNTAQTSVNATTVTIAYTY